MFRKKLRQIIAVAITSLSFFPTTAFAQQNTREIFERARMLDESNQNLSEAIKLYSQVVSQSNEQRALAAKAQYRIGVLYERLGRKAEAQKAFQSVVNHYADQSEVAQRARAKLPASAVKNDKARIKAVAAANTGIVNVQKWTGSKVDSEGSVSPDGRYLSFVDWETGDLALHDFTTGADRRLTNKGTWSQSSDFAEESAISHDGTQVAYTWYVNDKNRCEVRLLRLDALATSKPKMIFDDPNVVWIDTYDWSPDGKWLAVELERKDHTHQLALLSTTDAAVKLLKAVDSRGATRMFFSPDGAFIAYDLRGGNTSEQRDVFVMGIDGGQDTTAVVNAANDIAIGWAPDGRSLLFASDRTGSMALWALPLENGNPRGTPVFLKELGSSVVTSLGLTRSGSLLYGVGLGGGHIDVASIDFETGKVLAPPKQIAEPYLLEDQWPDWSRDGKDIAYISGTRNHFALVIRSVETGQTRSLSLQMGGVGRPRWSPDGSILVQGTDARGRQGIYKVDTQSGDLFPVVISKPDTYSVQFSMSPDGKLLFYRTEPRDVPRTPQTIIERNLTSGTERELVRVDNPLYGLSLSPDGRQIAFMERDIASKRDTLYIMPLDGEPKRELFRASLLLNGTEWTPDGRHIVFASREQEKTNYWIIPSSGGTPVKLELEKISASNSLRIHPDGRRIAFNSGSRTNEVWALENFLPAATTMKK